MNTFTISTLCTVAGIAVTALFSYIAINRAQRKENKDEGENKGVILSDIGYIKAGIDDLKRGHRETVTAVAQLSERLTRVEESCKQAHKRLDEIHADSKGGN